MRSEVWDPSISSYCWMLMSISLTAVEGEWFAKGQRENTLLVWHRSIWHLFLSLSLSSLAIQGKRDLSSGVSSPAALPRLHPEGISTRMACWRSRPALWLYTSEFTLLEWPRAWTGNQPPHLGLPSKTHGFLKHKSSPARRRTAFEFNPKVQYWTTSAFNEPGWPLWV